MREDKASFFGTGVFSAFLACFFIGLFFLPKLGNPSVSKIGVGLFILSIACIIILSNNKIKLLLLKFWILIIATYNLLIGIFAEPEASSSEVVLLVSLKDILVIIFFVLLLFGLLTRSEVFADQKNIVKVSFMYIFIVIVGIVVSLINGVAHMAILAGSRNLIIFPSAFIVGFYVGQNIREREIFYFVKFISIVTIGMILFGLIEFFFLEVEVFWHKTVHIMEYMRDKGAISNLWMPGLLGFPRRMYGSLISPSQFGAFIATSFPLMLIAIRRMPFKILFALLTLFISILTFSKASFVILAVGILAYAVLSKKVVLANLSLFSLGILSYFLMKGMIHIDISHVRSTVFHLKGALDGLKSMFSAPLGFGVGAGGTLAKEFGGISRGLESGIGTLGTNLGIIGVTLYLLFFYKLLLLLTKVYRKNKKSGKISLALCCSIAGLFTAQLFNENLMSTINTGPFIVLAGLLIGFYRRTVFNPAYKNMLRDK